MNDCIQFLAGLNSCLFVCVEVLWPRQPNGACQVWSFYLPTLLLGRLRPLGCLFVLFRLYADFNKLSVISRWCLDLAGS